MLSSLLFVPSISIVLLEKYSSTAAAGEVRPTSAVQKSRAEIEGMITVHKRPLEFRTRAFPIRCSDVIGDEPRLFWGS